MQMITESLENKLYLFCTFFDISQAIGKVWHTELLYEFRLLLPLNYSILFKSYLHSGQFLVKFESEYTELSSV